MVSWIQQRNGASSAHNSVHRHPKTASRALQSTSGLSCAPKASAPLSVTASAKAHRSRMQGATRAPGKSTFMQPSNVQPARSQCKDKTHTTCAYSTRAPETAPGGQQSRLQHAMRRGRPAEWAYSTLRQRNDGRRSVLDHGDHVSTSCRLGLGQQLQPTCSRPS